MEFADLGEVLGPDEPAYRARQLYDALYSNRTATSPQYNYTPARIEGAAGGVARSRIAEPASATIRWTARAGTCWGWTTAGASRPC